MTDGLKIQKLSKADIKQRVHEIAGVIGLEIAISRTSSYADTVDEMFVTDRQIEIQYTAGDIVIETSALGLAHLRRAQRARA